MWDVASRIWSIQLVEFLYNCRQSISSYAESVSMWCIHIIVLTRLLLGETAFYFIGFANGPGDRGSILGRVILKTEKMVLDAALLNTQHYKVRIKGKVEQSRERSSALPYTLV